MHINLNCNNEIDFEEISQHLSKEITLHAAIVKEPNTRILSITSWELFSLVVYLRFRGDAKHAFYVLFCFVFFLPNVIGISKDLHTKRQLC